MNEPANPEEAIFDQALGWNSPDEREAFVRQACGEDVGLRERVLGLLRAHAAAGKFLGDPTGAAPPLPATADLLPGGTPTSAVVSEKPGDRIGRYKLLEPLGEGGWGVVYLAEQEEPLRRHVALKVIKRGMDTRQVIARFEAERQALALMDHPNIAKVLDAGATDTGRPYFVMELVQGVAITEYCDQHHLPIRARLDLFIKVCQAVQHAHQKGIIHRDIKPSNILVTVSDGVPVPKVIDFGIVKAIGQRLTDKTLHTRLEHFIGTPCYMSPEQAGLGGLDMDTRSDIYALGVLLYELLTGRTPFESKELLRLSLDEMRRTIREREPARPSTRLRTLSEADLATLAERRQTEAPQLIHLVRGDLDWIVMRCLEKDRNRRYATANGLAADIQRHVNHEPVVARPPSKLYRLRKLARRNLVAFTAVNAVAATLAIGLGVSLWLLRRERQAHREAHEAEARATVHLSDSFLAEARAHRFSGRAGRRFEGLDAVVRAVALTPGAEDRFRLELRNQAIALLALSDVRIGRRLQTPSGEAAPCAVDSAYRLYAYSDRSGNVTLRRFAEDRAVTILPGFGFHAALLQFNLDGKYLAVQYDNAQRAGNKVIQIWELPESHTGRATGSSEQERGLQAASALVTDEASDAPPSSGVSAVLRPGNARNSQAHSRVVLALTNVLPRTSGVAFDFHPVLPRVAIPDGEQTIALYDLPSGQRSGRVTTKVPPYAFAFSPDGQWLAVSGYGRTNVFVLALPDGSLAHTLSHPRGVLSLAWHPSEQVLATGTAGGHVHLWDVTEGLQHTLSHGHRDQVVRFAFSRDGNLLASGGWDNKVCLWDPVTEELLCRISARAAPLIFDLAGQWLGLAPEAETLRVLEVAPNYVCRTLRLHAATNIVPLGAFSNDGRVLAVATEHGTALWDLTRRIEARRLGSQQVRAVQFTPDGKNLLVGGNSLQRWPIRVEEGRPAHLRLGPVQPLITSQDVPGLCLIPGTRKVAFVSGVSQSGGILDLDAPSRRIPLRGAMAASTVSASPDGQWLATGTWHSQDVVIWDAASGATITNLPVGTSATALFSPDGQWLVTTSKGQITQWETRSWRARHRYAAEPGAGLMAFSPDARLLAIRKSDAEVLLLSPERGQEVATLPGELPLPLCFSPDGALLAVVEDERRVRLWDLRRLRAELTKLTLDWDLPPYPAVKIAASVPPLRVEVVTE